MNSDDVPAIGDLVQHCNARTEYELIKHPYRPDECAECSRLRDVLRETGARLPDMHRVDWRYWAAGKRVCVKCGVDWPCNE